MRQHARATAILTRSVMQMIFRLKMKLKSQVRWHVPACGGYQRMPEPAPLEAKLLTLLLPSQIALEVHSSAFAPGLCNRLLGTNATTDIKARLRKTKDNQLTDAGEEETTRFLRLQVLSLQPQGCCLNNAHIPDARRREQFESLDDFWQVYQEHEVGRHCYNRRWQTCKSFISQ